MFSGLCCLGTPASMAHWLSSNPPDQCPSFPALSPWLGVWHAWATSIGSLVFGLPVGVGWATQGGAGYQRGEKDEVRAVPPFPFGGPLPVAANSCSLLVLGLAPCLCSFCPCNRNSSPLLLRWFPLTLPASLKTCTTQPDWVICFISEPSGYMCIASVCKTRSFSEFCKKTTSVYSSYLCRKCCWFVGDLMHCTEKTTVTYPWGPWSRHSLPSWQRLHSSPLPSSTSQPTSFL